MWLYFFFIRIFAFLGHSKARLLQQGQKQVIPSIEKWRRSLSSTVRVIWFHVASVGEFEQARPLLEKLCAENKPDQAVLLTVFSPSVYQIRKNYEKVSYVSYLPFATKQNAGDFIKIVQPYMAVFVKYEFWPAYLHALQQEKIPTYLISAIFRPDQLFFKPFGYSYRQLLACFNELFVQDEYSAQLLAKYHINNVTISGDTRFDRVVQIAHNPIENNIVKSFLSERNTYFSICNVFPPYKVIVAGSVYEKDVDLLSRYFTEHPGTKMIIVPHEITENILTLIFNRFSGRIVRYSEATEFNILHVPVLVVDVVGILSSLYIYADVAYIGGGFNKGIHNVLEAAVYDIPVIFGPKYKKFREACELINCGAALAIKDYLTLSSALDKAIQNKKTMGEEANKFITKERGATEKIYEKLFKSKD